MKIDCEIIRDLLPLYAEEMVSEASKTEVEEHLKHCEECRKIYETIAAPVPKIHFEMEPAKSFRKYIKKKKWAFGWKVALVSSAAVFAVVVIRLMIIGGLLAFLALDSENAEVEIDTQISHYSWYMGEGAEEKYRNKWGMDERIFPEQISTKMKVTDYQMVYYNPWDAQYLSCLTAEYDDEAYAREVERLNGCGTGEYLGYYGAEGFKEPYELLAMNADPYHGFVYALTDGKNQIIYIEMIFCNYFMDLDYQKYIKAEYLPVGFDASRNNPYREKMLGKGKK